MKCDAAAFAGMYETIYKDLYRYALCMMRNPHDAEDVVSETVIKGYERIHTLRSEDAFKSWMFTILSNVLFIDCQSCLSESSRPLLDVMPV